MLNKFCSIAKITIMREIILKKYPDWIIREDGAVLSVRYSRKEIKDDISTRGYNKINSKKYGTKLRHRLVAEAFVEGYFEGATVDHKDGNKLNNHYTNLEWVSRAENVRRHYEGNRELPIGVYKKGNRFRAAKWRDGKLNSIGYYKTIEEAKKAYEIWR